jgi:hypothetical protein
MSCIYFFLKNSEDYVVLSKNLIFLNKAREHLEKYLECCSMKTSQIQTQLSWKQQKIETQALCKQMTPQDVNRLECTLIYCRRLLNFFCFKLFECNNFTNRSDEISKQL